MRGRQIAILRHLSNGPNFYFGRAELSEISDAFPIRPAERGEACEIVPWGGSASPSPPIRKVCSLPSERRILTVLPNCTSVVSRGFGITRALARRRPNSADHVTPQPVPNDPASYMSLARAVSNIGDRFIRRGNSLRRQYLRRITTQATHTVGARLVTEQRDSSNLPGSVVQLPSTAPM
jgi:hypothetical protein